MSHVLRTRLDDNSPWSDPQEYDTKRERDKAAAFARVIGGIRTHSYFETAKEKEARISKGQTA